MLTMDGENPKAVEFDRLVAELVREQEMHLLLVRVNSHISMFYDN